jgi:valyl-tRNA synthetase
MNQAFEEREFARSTQISHRYLYDELFDVFIENSKAILDGTPEEARSAKDTLYTTLETGLRLVSPFMPFLTEELWQRLPRRPGDDTASITIAEYPEYDSSFHDPESEVAYALVLGCARGIRSLLSDYAVKDKGVAYIAPLDHKSHGTVSAQLSAIESLCGKTPVKIIILKAGEALPTDCAVFPISADANVYLEVKDRVTNATQEVEKFKAKANEARREQADIDAIKAELSKVQDKDVTDALQSAERRQRDVEARLRVLEETVTMFENMKV